jgi:hypothetical protein
MPLKLLDAILKLDVLFKRSRYCSYIAREAIKEEEKNKRRYAKEIIRQAKFARAKEYA